MATLLYRLGKTAYRRWPMFIAGWLLVIVGVGAVAGTMSKPMSDAFSIPGIPSEKAADMQKELFPGMQAGFDEASATLVVSAPAGHTLKEAKYSGAVDNLIAEMAKVPQMPKTPLLNPVTTNGAGFEQTVASMVKQKVPRANAEQMVRETLSKDGRVGTIGWTFDVKTVTDVKPETQEKVIDVMADARKSGLIAEANGAGMQAMTEPGGSAELIGIGVALIVLFLTFGSLVSAGLPIITAVYGVALGTIGVTAMTAFMDIGSSAPILSSMIGLAVGIDYTLFILARYRAEMQDTDDRIEAVGRAVGTAGSAVVFAGLTVLIALSALAVVGIPFLTTMGLAAAGTVFVAVLVALTLLPAILGMLKSKAFGGQLRKFHPKRESDGKILNNGVRWARFVGKRPIIVTLLVIIGLGSLALPAKDMHLALPSDTTSPTDTTQRKAADLIADSFGPGVNAPFVVVADAREVKDAAGRPDAFNQVVTWTKGHQGVADARILAMNPDGTGALIRVTPTTGPEDSKTEALLKSLRDDQSAIESKTGTTVGVTGLTPIATDVSERLSGALPIYLAVVIGLAFILLMLVFRSILVPLTATLGFLLSVMATLGATVAVFQEGAFGLVEGQPLVSFMPIFVIGIVFGLAMDYQVFLVTRIREAHVHGATMKEAVVDGFRNSARVVSAAAVIMISVFAAFMLMPDPLIKSIGFALAVAVFFDAFVIRMALIPALMYLMGDKAWYLPKWLDRILPNVDVEGESLTKLREEQDRAKALEGSDGDKRDDDLVPAGV